MKAILTLSLTLVVAVVTGCADKAKEAEKAKADAAAKARADAARKEMDTLPKVFQTRDIYKENKPAKPADAKATEIATPKKS